MIIDTRGWVQWGAIMGLLLAAPVHSSAEVKLIIPDGYLPGVPFPCRIELRDRTGARDWNVWNAEATLTANQAGVLLSTNRVVLRNGLGTALLSITGTSDFDLTAQVNGEQAVRAVRNRSQESISSVSGTLPGATTTWSGIVHVTADTTIPVGHTLTIQPSTWVIVTGVASGTSGAAISVHGILQSLGTEQQPVTITSSAPELNWGQIRHDGSQPSLYRYTFVSKAGRSPGEGHTGTGPAYRLTNTSVTFESCLISDLTAHGSTVGKIMMANGSALVMRDTVLTRARMGPEIAGTGLVLTNSYILEMNGPDDADGIYLHGAGGRPITLSGCVFAGGDDDAVDTLDSNVTLENCILRDWPNPNEDAKGVSAFNGEVDLRRCLIVNCYAGVSAKSGGPSAVVRIDHCTVIGITQGVAAATKANASAGNISIYITNSIVRAPDVLHSDFGPVKFAAVTYCDLSAPWPGVGNITADPQFANAAAGDFHLAPDSPCIDSGDPAFPTSIAGERTDIGFYSAAAVAPKSAPPTLVSQSPPPGRVSVLREVTVVFSSPVTGVDAADLLIGSEPADAVSGKGAGPYTFTFSQPVSGRIIVTWSPAHGILDNQKIEFSGESWTYILEANVADVVINEIMYHPISENPLEEYIEIFNRGSAPVELSGWKLATAVDFVFPELTLQEGAYLVIAADQTAFRKKYPQVNNVVGDWTGTLSNSREVIDLRDGFGRRVASVAYAERGDWAMRRRGVSDRSHRGWDWFATHDGLGKSLELIDPKMPANCGQNWAASGPAEGTPGSPNSVLSNRIPPLIQSVAHFPVIPKSRDSVRVTARITTEPGGSAAVTLNYRVDSATPPAFQSLPMTDDGQGGDVAALDGVYSATLSPQPNNSVIEFFIVANDSANGARTWPAAAAPAPDGAGPSGSVANALFQVDDTEYTGTQPLYKIIMTAAERAELQAIDDNVGGSANSDAQMNATFISRDGTGTEFRYLTGVRNRGHGSRTAKPNNYRVNFRTDEKWKGASALNLNSQMTWLQVLGSALNLHSGMAGANSRAVQLRVNNANMALVGGTDRTYGSFAANEVVNADWADRHFPDDGEGNVYRVLRDLTPSDFDYRTRAAYPTSRGPEDKNSYTNTWFKTTNRTENDWSDLIAMLRVFGLNGTEPFTPEKVRQVIHVEQWMRHLAIMNLLGNSETGLNSGYNDDYFMYRGNVDRRFLLLFYDQDQILGYNGSFSPNAAINSAGSIGGSQRSGPAFDRFLRHPEFQPIYYAMLKDLLETTFSAPRFDALVEQLLGDFVPAAVRTQIKSWMSSRRTYVLAQLPAVTTAPLLSPALLGLPRSPTPRSTAVFTVGGNGVTHYSHSLNGADFSPETPIASPIALSELTNGTNTLTVLVRGASGNFASALNAITVSWIVDLQWPGVRLNEILAARSGRLPDQIELFNEGPTPVDLAGMQLTDDPGTPAKYTFGSMVLEAGAYLTLTADQLGFGFDATGESLHLFQSARAGGTLLDSVRFGPQLTDFSIGRLGDTGDWTLTQPSLGAANSAAALGNPARLRINEWLARGINPYPDDFIELYNPDSKPIELAGCFLTDQPLGAPTRHRVAALSFIPANGYLALTSGPGTRPTEINFHLSADQGQIALFAPGHTLIDSVIYGPQWAGAAQGRCPDGDPTQKPLLTPTPGAPNQCPVAAAAPQGVTLIPFNQVWRYEASGADLGANWKDPGFQDGSWSAGPGLLGLETAALAEPIRTPFTIGTNKITFYFRTSFTVNPSLSPSVLQITHLIDDGAAFYLNGQEIGTRYNLPAAASSQTFAPTSIEATLQTMTIPGSQLRAGTNVMAVEVHQVNRTSSDLVFGLKLEALVATTSASQAGIVINEVLANNGSFVEPDGSKPDWVELYNPSTNTVDLAGMRLTDQISDSQRWIFPKGTLLPGRGILTVRCDPEALVSGTNTGFGLKPTGGGIYLFHGPNEGGGLQSSVTFGVQAPDWTLGRFPDGGSNWVLCTPTLGLANRVATLGNPRLLKINEWMADPNAGEDWFEIFNPNPEPVELSRLWLSDNLTDPLKQEIPPRSFIGQGTFAFQTFEADGNLAAGADHVNFKLSASGEALGIFTAEGALIDGISFGLQSTGISQGRLPDGQTKIVSFATTPTPGASNFLPLDNIIINEVLSHTDPPFEDAVEFYNPTASPVDLSGWYLTDSAVNLRKFQIPDKTVIPPGGYLVFYEYQFNSDSASEPFSFSSAKGDEVHLSQASSGILTGYRISVAFGPSENGVSFGRFRTSQGFHFVPMVQTTFGHDRPSTTNEFSLGSGAANSSPKIGPVVISEIMYHPAITNDALEFIELRNVSPNLVPLYDPANPTHPWRLRKGVSFSFPAGASIASGGSLVVVGFDPQTDAAALATFRKAYGAKANVVGPYSGRLDNGGDTIELQKPDPPQTVPGPDFGLVPYILVDRVDYADTAPWPTSADGTGSSLHRKDVRLYGNDPVNWTAAAPDPGDGGALSSDADNDGLPDDWEIAHGLNPGDPTDAAADPDRDGVSNLLEFAAGTDPRNGASVLKGEASVNPRGELILTFTASANRIYRIEFRVALAAGSWQIMKEIDSASTERVIQIPVTPSGTAGFYRIVVTGTP